MGLFCAYGYLSFLEDKGKFKYYLYFAICFTGFLHTFALQGAP